MLHLWHIQLHLLTNIPDFMSLQSLLHHQFHITDFISLHFQTQISFQFISVYSTIDFSFDFHYGLHFICYIRRRLRFSFCVTFMADFISLPSSYHRYHFSALLISTTNFMLVFFCDSRNLDPSFHSVAISIGDCYLRNIFPFSSKFQHRFLFNCNS